MRNILSLKYIFLILIITAGFIQIIYSIKNRQIREIEEKELNIHSEKIENCIDIENKSRRRVYENIKLSEYCIDKFGTFK